MTKFHSDVGNGIHHSIEKHTPKVQHGVFQELSGSNLSTLIYGELSHE